MAKRVIKNENRGFKGIWIDKDLWLNENLSVMEILFLAEIDSLEQGDQGCFASNNHFAEFFGISRSRCSQVITGLIKNGFLIAKYDRTPSKQITKRHLWVVNKLTTPSKFSKQGYLENCEGSNTVLSNTKNNNAHSSNAPHSLEHDFELLWNLYPKKKGKQKAFSAYKRAIKNGTTNKEIQTGIVNYLKEIKLLKTDDQFIKYGSTWFNNRNWEDDYQTSPEPQGSNQSQFTDQVAVTRRNEFVFTIYSEHQPNLDDAVPEIQRKYPELSELVIKQILWPEKYGDPGGVTNGNQQISSAN